MRWVSRLWIAAMVACGLIMVHSVALAVSKDYREIVPQWLGGMATKDITITFEPIPPGYIGAPGGFTATYVSDNQVRLDWTLGYDAAVTTIRAKLGGYPVESTDGYLVYWGPGISANDTAIHFNNVLGTVYYAAWSENTTGGISPQYATAQLENPWMVIIAEYFPTLVLILISGLLCALAYWRDDMWLYITAGIGAMFLGFSVIELNVGIGLVIILFGIYTIIRAMLAWRKRGIV